MKILKFGYNKLLYLKFVSSGIIAFTAFFYAFAILKSNLYFFIPLLIAYIILYFFLLLIFKSFSYEDIKILELIERKIGIEFRFVKKLIKQ